MNLREWARATHNTISRKSVESRNVDFSIAYVETIVRISITTLVDALIAGGDLRIEELGQIWVEEKPSRAMVGNFGGEQRNYRLGPRRVVRFRPSKRLQSHLNKKAGNKDLHGD